MPELHQTLQLALRELKHGWRHFATFLACLMLGVAVITTIGTLQTAINKALHNEAGSLLGGNVEVSVTGRAILPEQLAVLESFGAVSHVATMRTMLRHGETPLLVELKAVDDAYPLLGDLQLDRERNGVFAEDTIVVDQNLLEELGLAVGDSVSLGTETYRISAVLKREPDRVVQLFFFGPRLMLSHAALVRSGLTSGMTLIRQHYRMVLSEGNTAEAVEQVLKRKFPQVAFRIKTGTDGSDSVEDFIAQLALFLTLAGIATFLIGGVGIGSSVHAYLTRKMETIAVMKTLGASRRTILLVYGWVLSILAICGGIAGVILAVLSGYIFMPMLATMLPVAKDAWLDIPSALLAVWYGVLIVYLFSLPALLRALGVQPSVLFRRGVSIASHAIGRTGWLVGALLASLLFLTLLLSHEHKLFIMGAAGMAMGTFLLFFACTRGVKWLARNLKVTQPWLRLALGNLHRPGATTGTVVLAIGVSLTVLIALTVTEANFKARIARVIEAEAPSLFMIDIQPDQKDGLQQMLVNAAEGKGKVMVFPMVRGRIVALNGKPVEEDQVAEEVRWAVRGDRGLSFSSMPPANARITSGTWWPEDYKGEPLLSVDEKFLPGMGLKLGDTITLNIMGEEVTAKIANTRGIDYTSFQINFAMMLSPGAIDDFPHSFVATVFLQDNEETAKRMMREIAAAYPSVTTIHTTDAVNRVREVLEKIGVALRITVTISLIAGLLVLSSALSAMLGERLYDTAILKVLGARRSDILKAYTTEWLLLACATALIAAIIGTLSAWALIRLFPAGGAFAPMPHVTLLTMLGCAAVICLVGYFGNRQVFSLRPASLLRNE